MITLQNEKLQRFSRDFVVEKNDFTIRLLLLRIYFIRVMALEACVPRTKRLYFRTRNRAVSLFEKSFRSRMCKQSLYTWHFVTGENDFNYLV